ncbi:hypothetical protein [Streptomyces sp. NPDC021356]|uniref:hypothetical protein n=1 Tax=Streptomyces sp. NPDC021356 TaxID=3154900 RepID=UPI00340B8EBA
MRSARRGVVWPAACTWSAVVGLVVAGCWFLGRPGEPPAGADRVAVGRECRSSLPRNMELSCGTYGFGDVRYICSAGSGSGGGGRCARTTMVTVRNSGRSRVYVTYIAGRGQGVREQGPQQVVEPGREVTLRPGEGRLLFDITLRGADGGPSSLEVVRVR